MDDALLITQLEDLANKLHVIVRYEPMNDEEVMVRGGLCRVRDQHLIIIDQKAGIQEQTRVLAASLRRFDLGGIYLRPGVRAILEKQGEKDDHSD